MMIVIVLEKCPLSLRGDLTKWLQEVSLGVYVGQVSSRVRDELWERVCDQSKTGKATMVYSVRNEQHLDFRVHNTTWEPIDFDGLKLMLRPSSARIKQHNRIPQGHSEKYWQTVSHGRRNLSRVAEPEEYVVIDIETTGLDPEKDEIVEMGALRIIDGVEIGSFQCLVNLEHPIPASIEKLTGLSVKRLETEGVPLKTGLSSFLTFVGQSPVIAHNVSFDCSFIDVACDTCDEDPFDNETIDTLELAHKLVSDASSYRLEALLQHLEIRIDDHLHRSIPDCRATQKLFTKLIEI